MKKILKNKLVKDTASLASGSVIAQIIALACTPILTRYFSPDDFGVLGGVLTVSGIVAVIVSLKYEMAIILSEDESETKALVKLCLLILAGFVFFVFPFFYIFPNFLVWLGLTDSSPLVITLLCLITLATGLQNIFYQWHNKLENYVLLSKNRVSQSISTLAIQLAFVFILGKSLGLVWGYVLGTFMALPVLVYPLRSSIFSLDTAKKKLIETAKKYYRFPYYTAAQNLLNSVSQGLPVLMLGKYFAAEQVGLYFFTVRILQLPSSIIGGSIRQVFYKRASDLRNDLPQLRKEFIKTTLGLFAIIIIPMLIVFFFGTQIFEFVFGKEWYTAGEFAKWMFLWVGIMFINPPANAILLILNKNKSQLVLDTLLVFFRFAALYVGGITGDIMYTIKLYTAVGVFFNVLLILYSYKLLKGWK